MRYPLILQQSEEDCGAACLATVAKFHGHNFSIGRIANWQAPDLAVPVCSDSAEEPNPSVSKRAMSKPRPNF